MAVQGRGVAGTPLRARLRPDETLLWHGRPEPEAYARYRHNPYLTAGLALATVLLVSYELATLLHLSSRLGYQVGALAGAVLLFALGWGKLSYLLSVGLQAHARRTFYAVTDQRVMVQVQPSGDQPLNYDELHLSDLKLSLQEQPLGLGTLFFGVTAFHFSLAFRSIPQARDVYQIIVEARQRQIEVEDRRPRSFARPDVWERYLEDGETMQWRGKPCIIQAAIFVLFGLIFAAVLSAAAVEEYPRLAAHPPPGLLMKDAVIGLAGVFLVCLWWAGADEARNTFYALTDRRLLRLYRVGKCPRFMEMDLGRANWLKLEWQALGIGSLTFGQVAPKEFTWRTIIGAPVVCRRMVEAIRDAKRKQRGLPSG